MIEDGKKVYSAIVTGTDPVSGESRCVTTKINPFTKISKSMCGKLGTRITFSGDEDHPFSPHKNLKLWQGGVNIDPVCGLMIDPGTYMEIKGKIERQGE